MLVQAVRTVHRTLVVVLSTVGVALVAAPNAAAAEPTRGTCSAEGVVRALQGPPSCTLTVACPADSVGCSFAARLTATSLTTIGTAQAKLVIANADTDDGLTLTCSAPAAIFATGPGASCSVPPFVVMSQPATTRFRVTCAWTGTTISVRARVTCDAGFEPVELHG